MNVEKLLKIDRRWIFLLVFVVVLSTFYATKKLGWTLPLKGTGTVKDVWTAIENLKPSNEREQPIVLMSLDFDPGSAPELEPQARAMLRQMFLNGQRVVGMTHWPTGLALSKRILVESVGEFDEVAVSYDLFPTKAKAEEHIAGKRKEGAAPPSFDLGALTAAIPDTRTPAERVKTLAEAARPVLKSSFVCVPGRAIIAGEGVEWSDHLHGAVATLKTGEYAIAKVGDQFAALRIVSRASTLTYGEDYAYLGTKPGLEILIISMGQSMYESFPTDDQGTRTRELDIMKTVPSLGDFDYLMVLAAGNSGEKWIAYGHERYKVKMSVGCTAVIAPDLYPFRQAKQIDGIVGGIRGAWEYEALTGVPGEGKEAALPQTAAHLLIIFLILICNVGYFLTRKKNPVRV
ncbi:MAG: hypothetical protein ACYTFT_00305 [Planctomycetota bacterium]|jgi:hypothetical protein